MKELKRNPLVLICTGLVIGIGVSLVVSLLLVPSKPDKKIPSTSITLTESSSSELTNNQPNTQIDLAGVLELDIATDRRLAVYSLLEGLDAEQIGDLLQNSFTLGITEHVASVQRLLFTELAHIDPEFSLELVWEAALAKQYEFFSIVIMEWASHDLEAAMQFAAALMEPWKSHAFRNILQTRRDSSHEQLADMAERFGASAILKELSYKSRLEEVIDEPKAAFEFALNADIPESQKAEMMSLITERWLDSGNSKNFGWMLDLIHQVFGEEGYHWRTVVAKLAANNPRTVWDELSTLSLDVQKRFNDTVFDFWVQQNPLEAIEALTETDYMSAEEYELPSLYSQWARANSEDLIHNINLIPEDYRSGALRSVVFHTADQLPATEVLAQLDRFDSMGINTKEASDEFLRIWSRRSPVEALEWIEKNYEEGSFERNWNIRSILVELARKDSTKAMEIALQQPINSRSEFTVISELLSQGKLEEGLMLIPSVREGPGLTGVYSYAAGFLIAAGRKADAMEFASGLGEQEKLSFYQDLIGNSWIISVEDRIAILQGLNDEEMRSSLATTFLRLNELNEVLTDKEIELIRSYVQEETN